MNSPAPIAPDRRRDRMTDGCAVVVALVALVAMLGFALDLDALRRLLPQFQAMKFNAVLCFWLLGVALWMRNRARWRIPLALLAVAIAGLTLIQGWIGHDFGIDQLLFRDPTPAAAAAPGRMSPIGALAISLCGIALALTDSRRMALRMGAEAITLVMLALGSVMVLNYVFKAQLPQNLPGFHWVQARTLGGGMILILALGLLSALRERVATPGWTLVKGTAWRLWLGFGVITALLLAVGVVSVTRLHSIESQFGGPEDASSLRVEATQALESYVLRYTVQMRLFVSGSVQSRAPAEAFARDVGQKLVAYQRLAETARQRELAERFQQQWQALQQRWQAQLAIPQGDPDELARLVEQRQVLQRFVDDEMKPDAKAAEQAHRIAVTAEIETAKAITLALLLGGIAIALITSVSVGRAVLASDAANQRLALIVEHSNDAILSTSLDGTILSWNAAAQRLFGYPAEAIVGQSIQRLLPPERKAEGDDLLQQLRRGEGVDQYETQRLNQDGRRIDVSLTLSPLKDAGGKLIGSAKIIRDISERKLADQVRRQGRAQFETLINQAPLGVFLLDADLRIRQANPVARSVWPVEPELIGRDFEELMRQLWPQATADEIMERYRHTLATGEGSFSSQVVDERQDPHAPKYYESQINRIPLPDGRHGVVCYFRDISERVLAQQKIRDSEARYRSLFNAMDEGFCIIDMVYDENRKPVDYRILEFNPAFEILTGLHQASGKCFRELVPNADPYLAQVYGQVALTGEPARFVKEVKALGGRWFDIYATRLEGAEPSRLAVLFRDVSEAKRAELRIRQLNASLEQRVAQRTAELAQKAEQLGLQNTELEQARRALELKASELAQASQYKSDFLANMSHELRTPLNSMLILSGMLAENRQGNLDARQVESARIVHEGGQSLLLLISDILDLAKVEAGRVELHPGLVALAELASTNEREFRPLAQKQGLSYAVVCASGLPPALLSDGQLVQQILRNLLANAFKFTQRGRVTLTLWPETAAESPLGRESIALEVSDTGIGIAPDKRELIFEAFQQADSGTTRRYGGTGLGLSISKELARLLGGVIRLRSEEGVGSRFSLHLPLALEAAAAGTVPAEANAGATGGAAGLRLAGGSDVEKREEAGLAWPNPKSEPAPLRAPARLALVVDDDARNRYSFSAILDYEGFDVVQADSGEQALQVLAATPHVAIVLVDIQMPGMSGHELLRVLRRDPRWRNLPAIAVTAQAFPADREKCLAAGASDYIAKPVDVRQLVAMLRRWTGPHGCVA